MILLAQLGARRHYAVAQILSKAGLLSKFFTDLYAPKALSVIAGVFPPSVQPPALRRWLSRVPNLGEGEETVSFPVFGARYLWLRASARNSEGILRADLWAGREFCRKIVRTGLGNAKAVYSFNSAGLELLAEAKGQGLGTTSEQTSAAAELEDSWLVAEAEAHPDWEEPRSKSKGLRAFVEREREEWALADTILCGSEFVREGLLSLGVSAGRCHVVPYGVSPTSGRSFRRRDSTKKLRVLTVGKVNLQKGAPYVLAAATALHKIAEFRIVGEVLVTDLAQRALSNYVNIVGQVPRPEVRDFYGWADVFLFPSVCEGSAAVCYEALAAGLPVITTPNAGSVVRDGIDGFVVRVADSEAMVEKLEILARDSELFAWMSANALERSREFTIEKYAERLLRVVLRSKPIPAARTAVVTS